MFSSCTIHSSIDSVEVCQLIIMSDEIEDLSELVEGYDYYVTTNDQPEPEVPVSILVSIINEHDNALILLNISIDSYDAFKLFVENSLNLELY